MKTEISLKVNFSVKCELSEGDLRALDALVGYGYDAFLNCFYTHMGKSYLEPHAADLKLLFEKIESLRHKLSEIDKAKTKLLELQKS